MHAWFMWITWVCVCMDTCVTCAKTLLGSSFEIIFILSRPKIWLKFYLGQNVHAHNSRIRTNFWLNRWMLIFELSGCGFQSCYGPLNFRYRACSEEGVPLHSGNYRVHIQSKSICDMIKTRLNLFVSWNKETQICFFINAAKIHLVVQNW